MQDTSVGAVVLIAVVAILILGMFVTLWLRDKGRADEVSEDRARTEAPPVHTRPRSAREGAADEPPHVSRERRQ
jgi:hypothetical protein